MDYATQLASTLKRKSSQQIKLRYIELVRDYKTNHGDVVDHQQKHVPMAFQQF